MSKAIALKNRHAYASAVRLLSAVAKEYPRSAVAFGLLGSIYFCELGNAREAVRCFQKAAVLSPRSEMASLGLFHALWECGLEEQALKEMKRFQSHSSSRDYDLIIAEMKTNPLDARAGRDGAPTRS